MNAIDLMQRTALAGVLFLTATAAMAAADEAQPSAIAEYQQAHMKMMHAMGSGYTGDPDHDFMAGMLPHHQGAIDMARIQLKYGQDPVARKLAEAIIAAQEREIRLIEAWLAAHPLPKDAPPSTPQQK